MADAASSDGMSAYPTGPNTSDGDGVVGVGTGVGVDMTKMYGQDPLYTKMVEDVNSEANVSAEANSEATIAAVEAKQRLSKFREDRKEKRKMVQYNVLNFATSLMGIAIFTVTSRLMLMQIFEMKIGMSGMIGEALPILGIFGGCIGFFLCTLTDPVDIDWDIEMLHPTWKSRSVYYALFVTHLGLALGFVRIPISPGPDPQLGVYPPAVLMAVVALYGCVIGGWREKWQQIPFVARPTILLSLWFAGFALGAQLFLPWLRLYGYSHADWSVITTFSIFHILIYWVFLFRLWLSLDFQSSTYTLLWYKSYWATVINLGTMFLANAYTADWSGFPDGRDFQGNTQADYMGGGIVYITVALAWFMGREKWTGMLARTFDSSQRLNDGCFVASLLKHSNLDDLMKTGQARLRRLPADKLTLEVLMPSAQHAWHRALAEPCGFGEIDFFISHSWRDDAHEKFELLLRLRAEFVAKVNREPYLWFDKVCLDENEFMIQLDLECLPIYMMACNTLVTVIGPSFPYRLWCAWEMYCFFCICEDTRQFHVEVLPSGRSSGALEHMKNFSLVNMECWSRGDRDLLLGVIGEDANRFELSIRQLTASYFAHLQPDVSQDTLFL